MIIAAVPGERWEIEIFEDNSLEVEIFSSDGQIHGKDFLLKGMEKFSDRS